MNHGLSPPTTLAEVERNNVDKYSEAKQTPRPGIWRRRDEQMLKKRTEWWRGVPQSHRNPEERRISCGGGSRRYRKNVKLSLHRNFIDWPLKKNRVARWIWGRETANWALRMILHFTVASQHCLLGGGLSWLSNCECFKCGTSSLLFNIRSWHCRYCVGCFVTVVDTLTAIWSEGTHTCDRTWLLLFFFVCIIFV